MSQVEVPSTAFPVARALAGSDDTELHTKYLRPAPRASAGINRGVPVSVATQVVPPAREASGKEES